MFLTSLPFLELDKRTGVQPLIGRVNARESIPSPQSSPRQAGTRGTTNRRQQPMDGGPGDKAYRSCRAWIITAAKRHRSVERFHRVHLL